MSVIEWNTLSKGMNTGASDAQGVAYAVDVWPWENGLRKRGGVASQQSFTSQTTTLHEQWGVGYKKDSGTIVFSPGHSLGTYLNWVEGFGSGATNIQAATGFLQTSYYVETNPITRWVPAGDEVIGIREKSTTTTLDQFQPGLVRWAGATSAGNATGTVTISSGSNRLVGVGTSFTSELTTKHFVMMKASGGGGAGVAYHRVASIESDTLIYLETSAEQAYTTQAFARVAVAPLNCAPALITGTSVFQTAKVSSSSLVGKAAYTNHATARAAAYHEGRLVVANLVDGRYRGSAQPNALIAHRPGRIRWSALPEESNPARSGISVAAGAFKGIEYFHSNAVLELGSVGGEITGLVSLGGSLVILRESAVQILTGSLSTTGEDLGASIQTVALGVGAHDQNAWDVGEKGVVFCDQNGAYVFDGQKIVNLVEDRIDDLWRAVNKREYDYGVANSIDNPKAPRFVSYINNRVMFSCSNIQPAATPNNEHFVYHINKDAWFMHSVAKPFGRVIECGFEQEMFWYPRTSTGTTFPGIANMYSQIGSDYLITDSQDGHDTHTITPIVKTKAQPLGGMGRMVRALVASRGNRETGNTDNLLIEAGKGGAIGPGALNEFDEHTLIAAPSDGLNASQTIELGEVIEWPLYESPLISECEVRVSYQSAAGNHYFGWLLTAIAAEVEVDDKFGQSYD